MAELCARTVGRADTAEVCAAVFADAWARRGEAPDDAAHWVAAIAEDHIVERLATPVRTTGGTSPRNVRRVVDHAAIEGIRTELLAADPDALPAVSARIWPAVERAVHPPLPPDADRTTTPTPPGPAHRRPRAGRRFVLWVVVAVVLLAAAATATLLLQKQGRPVVASATLRPVNGVSVGLASADVSIERGAGRLEVRLRMETPPALTAGSSYELALIDRRGVRHQVGRLRDRPRAVNRRFPLPEGFDLAAFRTVDLSVRDDAVAGPDGLTSIMRGNLRS